MATIVATAPTSVSRRAVKAAVREEFRARSYAAAVKNGPPVQTQKPRAQARPKPAPRLSLSKPAGPAPSALPAALPTAASSTAPTPSAPTPSSTPPVERAAPSTAPSARSPIEHAPTPPASTPRSPPAEPASGIPQDPPDLFPEECKDKDSYIRTLLQLLNLFVQFIPQGHPKREWLIETVQELGVSPPDD